MLYEDIPLMSREAIEEQLQSASPEVAARALISAALHDSDFDWVQQKCLEFLAGSDLGLRGTALVSLGHLARLHGRIDLAKVHQMLATTERIPQLAGLVSDLRDDIDVYIHRKAARTDSR